MIAERDSTDYEACHWIISVEENKYRDDTNAYIELRFETMENAEVYLYAGTGRGNATVFIEHNQTASLGAPFRAPISSKLIVVASTTANSITGNVAFSYQLFNEKEYAWFFKPFVGEVKAAWYFGAAAVLLTPLIIVVVICLCCCYCSCCRCYCCCADDKMTK